MQPFTSHPSTPCPRPSLFHTAIKQDKSEAAAELVVLTGMAVKLARMRNTVNSLETLDSDMRDQNLRILKSMEEATVAKITTSTDVSQEA